MASIQSKYMNVPRPSKGVKFQPLQVGLFLVVFWGTNFTPLENSGMYIFANIIYISYTCLKLEMEVHRKGERNNYLYATACNNA